MAAEWQRLVRGREFDAGDDGVLVRLGVRSQQLSVVDEGESYLLTTVVARARIVRGLGSIDDLLLRAWRRNRVTPLVGFRLDSRERLVAEAWVPKLGLTPEEFQMYLRTVARESDRMEFELTGEDVE